MAKKKKTKQIEQAAEKVKKNNFDSQTKFVLVFMAILILIILLTYLAIRESKKFEYLGVQFYKNDGRCPTGFYLGEFPLGDDQHLRFCFRQDPRNIHIPINGSILLTDSVALAMDSSYTQKCEDSIVAATTLSVFLGQLGANAYGATTNITEARDLNRTYINCSSTSGSGVVFKDSQENIIKRDGKCYIIEIKDCAILNATERFMMGMWAGVNGVEL